MSAFRHWTSALPAWVKLRRVLNYPNKLRCVVGDPRSRIGTTFAAIAELSARCSASCGRGAVIG